LVSAIDNSLRDVEMEEEVVEVMAREPQRDIHHRAAMMMRFSGPFGRGAFSLYARERQTVAL